MPVTVAGPRRFCTGFRVPRVKFNCRRRTSGPNRHSERLHARSRASTSAAAPPRALHVGARTRGARIRPASPVQRTPRQVSAISRARRSCIGTSAPSRAAASPVHRCDAACELHARSSTAASAGQRHRAGRDVQLPSTDARARRSHRDRLAGPHVLREEALEATPLDVTGSTARDSFAGRACPAAPPAAPRTRLHRAPHDSSSGKRSQAPDTRTRSA